MFLFLCVTILGTGTVGKTPVFGMLERDGDVRAVVVPDANRKTLEPIIQANVAERARISSDEWQSYKRLWELGYRHGTVEHSAGQYVAGIHHTNGIEGFWSHFKRGIVSTHVSISPKHAQKYVDEFAYRYNKRKDPTAMFNTLMNAVSVRQI
jgi:transposase